MLNKNFEHFDANEPIEIYREINKFIKNSRILIEKTKKGHKLYKHYLNTIKS